MILNLVFPLFLAVPIFLLIFFAYPSKGAAIDSYGTLVYNEDVSAIVSQDLAALSVLDPVDEELRRNTLLPPSMCRKARSDEPADVSDPAEMRGDVDRFMGNYDEQTPFLGFYFKTNIAYDLETGDAGFDYRLEWDLFRDGLFEMKKNFEKKRNQNELQTLQLLNDTRQHWLNRKLDSIEPLTQAVHYRQASEFSTLLAEILVRRHAQLVAGYITRDDFDLIRLKYRQARLKKTLYAHGKDAGLAFDVHQLLNCGEYLNLIKLSEIKKTAIEQSYALKIQKNLTARAGLYAKSLTDEVGIDLFVEHSDRLNSYTHKSVGVELKIPLHWYSKRSLTVEREKRLYQKQAKVLKQRIETNAEKLHGFFGFHQYRIRTLLLDLEETAQRKRYEQERAKRVLEDLDQTPERSLDLILLEEIDLCYEAVQARLKLYEILIKLMALTHATDPRALIAGTQIDCPVR